MVGVGHRQYLAHLWDAVAGYAAGIPAPVKPLVVIPDYVRDVLVVGEVREHFGALLRMLADECPLLIVQTVRLAQNRIGNTHLAKIVQQAGQMERLRLFFRQAQGDGDVSAIHRDRGGVLCRVLVLAVKKDDHGCGKSDVHLEVLVAQLLLFRNMLALANQQLEHVLACEERHEQ